MSTITHRPSTAEGGGFFEEKREPPRRGIGRRPVLAGVAGAAALLAAAAAAGVRRIGGQAGTAEGSTNGGNQRGNPTDPDYLVDAIGRSPELRTAITGLLGTSELPSAGVNPDRPHANVAFEKPDGSRLVIRLFTGFQEPDRPTGGNTLADWQAGPGANTAVWGIPIELGPQTTAYHNLGIGAEGPTPFAGSNIFNRTGLPDETNVVVEYMSPDLMGWGEATRTQRLDAMTGALLDSGAMGPFERPAQ